VCLAQAAHEVKRQARLADARWAADRYQPVCLDQLAYFSSCTFAPDETGEERWQSEWS
jgi:hypothetical protein